MRLIGVASKPAVKMGFERNVLMRESQPQVRVVYGLGDVVKQESGGVWSEAHDALELFDRDG